MEIIKIRNSEELDGYIKSKEFHNIEIHFNHISGGMIDKSGIVSFPVILVECVTTSFFEANGCEQKVGVVTPQDFYE